MSTSILQTFNYSFKNFASISFYYQNGFREYKNIVDGLNHNSNDFTQWIEYFSQAYAIQSAKTQEKVKLLARDTKVSKVTSSTKLTDRQEKIVEFLQDYGVLQNKDFHRLFPEKSEDSILRDLKTLTQKGFIKKSGSTKSSVYELV